MFEDSLILEQKDNKRVIVTTRKGRYIDQISHSSWVSIQSMNISGTNVTVVGLDSSNRPRPVTLMLDKDFKFLGRQY